VKDSPLSVGLPIFENKNIYKTIPVKQCRTRAAFVIFKKVPKVSKHYPNRQKIAQSVHPVGDKVPIPKCLSTLVNEQSRRIIRKNGFLLS
jgi:hypothetical protein